MKQRYLVIMLKEPKPGRIKTRLARDIGVIPACWWFRHQVRFLLRHIEDPRWQVILALSPDSAQVKPYWPTHFRRIGQGQGDLGQRMARIMQNMPHGQVCIIGGDIPGIKRTHIACAFKALGHKEAVLGPTPDGGYWLVGFHRSRAISQTVFTNVRWSTEHALNDTVASLQGMSVMLTYILQDIDTGADLTQWKMCDFAR